MAAVTDDTATKGGQTNESWLLSASDDKLNKRRRIQSVVLKENGKHVYPKEFGNPGKLRKKIGEEKRWRPTTTKAQAKVRWNELTIWLPRKAASKFLPHEEKEVDLAEVSEW